MAAADVGVTFLDTAGLYNNYEAIALALKQRPELVVATKTYDYTADGLVASLERALSALGRDYVDIYLLHEQESAQTIRGHWEAIEQLLVARAAGRVRAIGLSTHHVAGVRAMLDFPELDVVHPIINREGIGIADGSIDEMLGAVRAVHAAGVGVYAMKALGGGHLAGEAAEALRFVADLRYVDSIAVGAGTVEEIAYNAALLSGERLPAPPPVHGKRLQVADWCRGCGLCVARCPHQALELVGGKAAVRPERCVLCAYCAPVCPDFCLKVF
ncbi:MAG: aldo/keto reductase [Bacillota bacterium]